MSEEILKALTQLFAIIAKQDSGSSSTERNFIINFFEQELDRKSVKDYVALYDQFAEAKIKVSDSVKILGICKKINQTLAQKQKVIVLLKIFEMLASEGVFSSNRMEIVDTISSVFKIPKEEYKLIESFAKAKNANDIMDSEDVLVFDDVRPTGKEKFKYIDSGHLDGEIIFIRIKSVDLYFTRYTGNDEIFLNGHLVKKDSLLLFSHGSVFKTPKGAPLYYSDLVSRYTIDTNLNKLTFLVKDLEFRFPNGAIGLRNINISEGSGRLIGIMGASGAGKTTLLNTLAGLEVPSAGEVLINGYNLHKQKDKLEGVIGYIAQDDLLIEDLTVFENLYYNAKLCFKDLNDEEIRKKVTTVLASLGLDRISGLKVGNVLNKKISGGQRKRLNIALELIREPAVLFVDEPTSGLSSRDSENVIDLLKELSLKGKLIFVVIHQPSSDIYKMFDKMFIMDTGGYPVYYGNPVEAITYFKKATNQVGSDKGQCPSCGNVNPEMIFNIVEARVVDEYGEFTNKRKITPPEWHDLFRQTHNIEFPKEIETAAPSTLKIPSKLFQTKIFTLRDFLSKISNSQYMLINLLEAPFLAILLSVIVRYKNGGLGDQYIFRYNDNVPAYILIAIIIALFMGLTVSAEEIIRDRKIQKREAFLNLSRTSYLASKVIILFALSAVQTLSFTIIGNLILDIKDMNIAYWLMLFSVSCFANVLGLNISASFNSAITVYIIIPLLLIPQMILSGAIFRFDQLNDYITAKGKVPLIADIMVSRWGFEALTVKQFKDNPYEKHFFDVEMKSNNASYRASFWIDEIENLINKCVAYKNEPNDSTKRLLEHDLGIIRNELMNLPIKKDVESVDLPKLLDAVNFGEEEAMALKAYLSSVRDSYNEKYNELIGRKDEINDSLDNALEISIADLQSIYHNERLSEWVKNTSVKKRIVENEKMRLVQQTDPIYNYPDPTMMSGTWDYRTHFYAPVKHFFGKYYDTYYFNMAIIWIMTVFLYISLYFEWLKKVIDLGGKISDFAVAKLQAIRLPKLTFLAKIKEKLKRKKPENQPTNEKKKKDKND